MALLVSVSGTYLGGIKVDVNFHGKFRGISMDFHFFCALFGLVSYNDPCLE